MTYQNSVDLVTSKERHVFLTALKSGRSKIKAPNDPVWSEGLPDPCFVDDIFLAVFSHGKGNSETFESFL